MDNIFSANRKSKWIIYFSAKEIKMDNIFFCKKKNKMDIYFLQIGNQNG
jgi:hypothetical protein